MAVEVSTRLHPSRDDAGEPRASHSNRVSAGEPIGVQGTSEGPSHGTWSQGLVRRPHRAGLFVRIVAGVTRVGMMRAADWGRIFGTGAHRATSREGAESAQAL